MNTFLFAFLVIFSIVLQSCEVLGFQFQGRRMMNHESLLRMSFDLEKAAQTLSKNRILTKTAKLGLLSRLEKAGFKLSSAIPLLKLADEKDLLGVLEASSDKVLPLLAKGIELSPQLLPLAAVAVKTPPSVLSAGALGSLGAAVALNFVIPDDSIGNIALETFLTIPLGVIIPGALTVGSVILSKTK